MRHMPKGRNEQKTNDVEWIKPKTFNIEVCAVAQPPKSSSSAHGAAAIAPTPKFRDIYRRTEHMDTSTTSPVYAAELRGMELAF